MTHETFQGPPPSVFIGDGFVHRRKGFAILPDLTVLAYRGAGRAQVWADHFDAKRDVPSGLRALSIRKGPHSSDMMGP